MMSIFKQHTIESAPRESRSTLEGAEKSLGFLPNLYAKLAESPVALSAYSKLSGIFEKSSLSTTQQQVVLLATSVYNGCEFCVAAHSLIAKNRLKVKPDIVEALRGNREIADPELNALALFTRKAVDQRGWVSEEDTRDFLAAGFTREQVLEVLVGVSLKTLSNYSNHITNTQPNPELATEYWQRPNSDVA